MTEKQDWTLKELGRLNVVLLRIYEGLPRPGEDSNATWEKVGNIKALLWSGLLGDDWLDKSFEQCDQEVKQLLHEMQHGGSWLRPKGE